MKKYDYLGTEVSLLFREYANGRTAIQLMSFDEEYQADVPFATATVNLPDEYITVGEVFIKNYSENEGMLMFLVKNNIVAPYHRVVKSGHVQIPVCNLLIQK